MRPVAFKSNAARMGYRELFRVAGSPGIGMVVCVLKLFRILGPENDGYGMRSLGDSLQRLDFDELPRQVTKATAGYWAKLEKLGFIPVFAYTIETFGCQEAYGQVFRSKDGITAVSIAYARCVKGTIETETTVFGFNTMLTDDTYIMTSGNKRLMNKPATFACEFMPDASPQAVLERHLDRVERADAQPRKIKTEGDLKRLVLNCENEETDFNIERGVYVRMSREEIELGTELKEDWERENAKGSGISRKKKKEDDEEDEEEEDEEDEDEESDEYER